LVLRSSSEVRSCLTGPRHTVTSRGTGNQKLRRFRAPLPWVIAGIGITAGKSIGIGFIRAKAHTASGTWSIRATTSKSEIVHHKKKNAGQGEQSKLFFL